MARGKDSIKTEEYEILFTSEQIQERVAELGSEIAEDYSVEFFAPQNELDVMISQFVSNDEEKSRIVSEWYKDILPKIRKIFSGRLIAKLADIRISDNFEGYDYVGTTIYHRNYGLQEFENYINTTYFTLSKVAEKSNAFWLVSEAWMPYTGPDYPFAENNEGISLDELQDDYFRIATQEYLEYNYTSPKGYRK